MKYSPIPGVGISFDLVSAPEVPLTLPNFRRIMDEALRGLEVEPGDLVLETPGASSVYILDYIIPIEEEMSLADFYKLLDAARETIAHAEHNISPTLELPDGDGVLNFKKRLPVVSTDDWNEDENPRTPQSNPNEDDYYV